VEIVVPNGKYRQCVAVEKSKIYASVANGSHPQIERAMYGTCKRARDGGLAQRQPAHLSANNRFAIDQARPNRELGDRHKRKSTRKVIPGARNADF
jgi:hypothetical protein